MRGSLRQRSKGTWTIIVPLGRDVEGKKRQHWETFKGTKKLAQDRLNEILMSLSGGTYVKPTKQTVADFLRTWLRDYAASHVRPSTLRGYRMIAENHLIPSLGHIILTDLRPSHLQACYAEKLAGGRQDRREGSLSARSILAQHRVLSEALGHAVKWGLLARNVANAVSPPRPQKKELRVIDATGARALLEAAKGTAWYSPLHLALHTGLRRSEIAGLRWSDLDLTLCSLSVCQGAHEVGGGKLVFLEPKTATSHRTIPLTPASAIELRAHREKQEADMDFLGIPWRDDGLVFGSPDGKPMRPSSLSHAFTRFAELAGLAEGCRLHDLRHAHASLMLRQGVNPKVIQERLGHSSIAVTLDIYGHLAPNLQQEAARQFDNILAAQSD